MFDFSSIFTPERMQQGAQGVQSVNQMPHVFNQYLPQIMQMLQQQQPQAPAAQLEQSPLQQVLSQSDLDQFFGRMQNDGGGA